MSVVSILKARRYGHSQILRLLLEAQATVDERDSGGGTALLKVAESGRRPSGAAS